jgi:hypothetical protein
MMRAHQEEQSPHAWQKPNCGAKTQHTPAEDATALRDAADIQHVQEVLGTFLFHARAVDSTMLVALNTLASQQSKGTRATLIALTQLLNYAATHPDACVLFAASGMCLHTSSDASCLSVPKARSRAAGFHHLSDHPGDPNAPPLPTDPEPPINGAIHVCTQTLKEVLSSASEAELELRCSTMERKRAPCVRALKNSATPNHRPQSRQTDRLTDRQTD